MIAQKAQCHAAHGTFITLLFAQCIPTPMAFPVSDKNLDQPSQ
jgi:hypothetical protein